MVHQLGEPLRAAMAWPREEEDDPQWPPKLPVLPNKWHKMANAVVATTKMITIGEAKKKTRIPPAWRSFSQVAVSGIDATLDKRSPLLRRVLWVLVLVICTSLMLTQCLDRIIRYSDEPVSVSVRVTHNNSLLFPAITLCNKNQFNRTAALQLAIKHKLLEAGAHEDEVNVTRLMSIRDMTVTDVWNAIAHRREVFVPECWFKRSRKCEDVGEWTTIHTVTGPCLTFTLTDSTSNTVGSFAGLYIRLQDETPMAPVGGDNGVRLLLHDPRERPVLLVRTHGMTAELGWGRDIKIELRKFQMLDTDKSPCVDDPAYLRSECVVHCFNTEHITLTRCRMPFMYEDGVHRECRSPEEYDAGMSAVHDLLILGGWAAQDCDCDYECYSVQFQTYPNNIGFKTKQSRIRVYYSDLVFEDITEARSYSMISLLCDIGGTLGLLMGASVLTVCELLEVLWSRILQGCCRLEERQPPPQRQPPPPRLKPDMQLALSKLRPPPPQVRPVDFESTFADTKKSTPFFMMSVYKENNSKNKNVLKTTTPSLSLAANHFLP